MPRRVATVFASSSEALTVRGPNLIVLALINLIRNALQAIEGQADAIVPQKPWRLMVGYIDHNRQWPRHFSGTIVCYLRLFLRSLVVAASVQYSHRIMRLHGGDLTVDSLPGVRTEFRGDVLEYDFLDFFPTTAERPRLTWLHYFSQRLVL